jgi:hypothetical protein
MLSRYWMSQKSGKGDALRKEKALLHTFVAGQKYGVGRDATRGFVFQKSNKDNRVTICCPLYHDLWLNFVSNLKTDSRLPLNSYQT